MFQELLVADLVVADLTLDNPNVWYELGVRHALRARGVVLVQGPRATQPFDIYTDRKLRYSLKDGAPDPARLPAERRQLVDMVTATATAWHGRTVSPVYHLIPNLQEPDWKSLRIGDAREFWERHDAWERRIDRARTAGCQAPGASQHDPPQRPRVADNRIVDHDDVVSQRTRCLGRSGHRVETPADDAGDRPTEARIAGLGRLGLRFG